MNQLPPPPQFKSHQKNIPIQKHLSNTLFQGFVKHITKNNCLLNEFVSTYLIFQKKKSTFQFDSTLTTEKMGLSRIYILIEPPQKNP